MKVEEEMEKEDKVKEELLVKNTLPLYKFAHICKTVRKIMFVRETSRYGDFGRF